MWSSGQRRACWQVQIYLPPTISCGDLTSQPFQDLLSNSEGEQTASRLGIDKPQKRKFIASPSKPGLVDYAVFGRYIMSMICEPELGVDVWYDKPEIKAWIADVCSIFLQEQTTITKNSCLCRCSMCTMDMPANTLGRISRTCLQATNKQQSNSAMIYISPVSYFMYTYLLWSGKPSNIICYATEEL